MNDLKGSGIFEDAEVAEEFDWEDFDQDSAKRLSEIDLKDELEAIKKLSIIEHQNESQQRRKQILEDSEKRIQAKMKEMEDKGLRGSGLDDDEEDEPIKQITTRYGRSPLHEAIVMRDIRLVKKYVKVGLYLDNEDNNGHTPMEMAYYEGYKEAMIVFNAYQSKK